MSDERPFDYPGSLQGDVPADPASRSRIKPHPFEESLAAIADGDDQRQGVSGSVHSVLDLLDAERGRWRALDWCDQLVPAVNDLADGRAVTGPDRRRVMVSAAARLLDAVEKLDRELGL